MVCDHCYCGWCGLLALLVLVDCIHRFGAVGDLLPGCAEW